MVRRRAGAPPPPGGRPPGGGGGGGAPATGGTAAGGRVLLAAAIFVIATYLISIPLYWLQGRFEIATWVFNLGTLGPFLGGLVALLVCRGLRLPLRWVAGLGFNVQVVRRSILAAAAALAIVLLAVQFYGFFHWQMKPIDLAGVPYPLAMPGDSGTIFGFIAIGLLIGCILEEFGWRTILEPTLLPKLGVLGTGIVVGVIWGLWQWPFWLALMQRQSTNPSRMQALLYTGSHFVAAIAVSLILVVIHQRMRHGHWAAAVAFRWVYGIGFFLILDEELGRWQPMFAIAACSALAAAVGYYYHWRRTRTKRVRPAARTAPSS